MNREEITTAIAEKRNSIGQLKAQLAGLGADIEQLLGQFESEWKVGDLIERDERWGYGSSAQTRTVRSRVKRLNFTDGGALSNMTVVRLKKDGTDSRTETLYHYALPTLRRVNAEPPAPVTTTTETKAE